MIHHWNDISEVQKLTQSVLIPGVIEENLFRGPLLAQGMPVAWTPGKTIKFLRELTDLTDKVAGVDIGDQLTWTSDVTYTEKEVELKRRYIQRIIDNFIPDVFGTVNDYRAIALQECKKGVYVDLNDQLIYGDKTFSAGNKEFDGIHAWAAEQSTSTTSGLNMDGEDAGLNLAKLRGMIDAMKAGMNFLYFPFVISRRLSAGLQEVGGEVNGVFTTRGQMAQLSYGINDVGKRAMFWDGIPIIPSDYLVAEESDTGDDGTEARAKYSSDSTYSIFGIKMGNVYRGEMGLMYGFGATNMSGDMYKMVPFENLEDYDAEGIRLVSYGATLLGSKYGLCRMYDVDDDDIIIST